MEASAEKEFVDRARVEGENPSLTSDIRVLEADRGQFMGFVRMVARRP
jgi:hypothetical protein